jgi:hypothetical protein
VLLYLTLLFHKKKLRSVIGFSLTSMKHFLKMLSSGRIWLESRRYGVKMAVPEIELVDLKEDKYH